MRLPLTRRRAAMMFGFFIVAYAVAVAVACAFEEQFVFRPDPALARWVPAPPESRVEDVWLTPAVHAWFLPAPDVAPAAGAVLFCHGQGGNLSLYRKTGERLRDELGLPVLMIDYPGYGRSGGSPCEQNCYAAADAAVRWLADARGVPADRLLIVGESLGGGVASEAAVRHGCRALVLLKTFTSLPEAAAVAVPVVPCGWVMRTRFATEEKLRRLARPVFLAHGTADRRIPYAHARRLLAAAAGPAELLTVEGAGHGMKLPPEFAGRLGAFLAKYAP